MYKKKMYVSNWRVYKNIVNISLLFSNELQLLRHPKHKNLIYVVKNGESLQKYC